MLCVCDRWHSFVMDGFSSSWQWQFTSVWTTSHHRISVGALHPGLQCWHAAASAFRQPSPIYLPYRVSGSTLTAVGRSQLLARWPGTHSRILSGIQRAAQTVLGVYLKRTCLRVASASSALAVLNDYALYRSTHSHLLTNLQGAKVWCHWRMLTRKCTVCLHTSATQQNHTLSVRYSLSIQLRSINAVASPGLAGRGTQNYIEMTWVTHIYIAARCF